MPTLLEVLQEINGQGMNAAQLCDMLTGTVESVSPLSIKTDMYQQQLRKEVLLLTEAVVEKKISLLGHSHSVTTDDGTYTTDSQLGSVVVTENGVPLPVSGEITINKGLAAGDKVLLLSVQKGQKFIVLSRIF